MENKNLYDYGSAAFSFNDYFSERKRKTKSKVEINVASLHRCLQSNHG